MFTHEWCFVSLLEAGRETTQTQRGQWPLRLSWAGSLRMVGDGGRQLGAAGEVCKMKLEQPERLCF